MKTHEVSSLTGATYRQIDHWVQRGYITPSIDATRGTGHIREWSTEDAVKVSLMAQLVAAGLDPATAAEFAKRIGSFPDGFFGRTSAAVSVWVNAGKIRDSLADRRDLIA